MRETFELDIMATHLVCEVIKVAGDLSAATSSSLRVAVSLSHLVGSSVG
jgi:hypothetical protein